MIKPINLTNLGAGGIVNDLLPWELPLNAFTDGRNVKFNDREVSKAKGHTAVYAGLPIAPAHLFLMRGVGNSQLWVVPGTEKVYAVDDSVGTWTNITRQTAGNDVNYTGSLTNFWNGGALNGVFVCNNGADVPQAWNPAETSQRLVNLPAWNSNWRARIVKPFRYYLVAYDITDTGTNYPFRVKWSDQAEPGTLPSTWTSLPDNDAGEQDLAEDAGRMLDAHTLRETNFIYRSGSVWKMDWTNTNDIFVFDRAFSTFGALAQDCVTTLKNQHVVLTDGDLLVHNGVDANSIIDGKMRRWLFNSISSTTFNQSFIVRNDATSEIWVCYPSQDILYCDKALVWNWRHNTFTVIDLPNLTFATQGRPTVDASGNSWSGDGAAWSSDTTAWNEGGYSPAALQIVSATEDSRILVWENSEQFDGTSFTAYVEKTGITWGDQNNQPDLYSWKMLRNLWLRLDGTSGGEVLVEVGVQEVPTGPIDWQPAQTWTIGTTQKLDMLLSGKLFALRIRSTTDISWRLQGAQFDVTRAGRA